jgi:hypothetical protein
VRLISWSLTVHPSFEAVRNRLTQAGGTGRAPKGVICDTLWAGRQGPREALCKQICSVTEGRQARGTDRAAV